MLSMKFSTWNLKEVIDLLDFYNKKQDKLFYLQLKTNSKNPCPPYWYEGCIGIKEDEDIEKGRNPEICFE